MCETACFNVQKPQSVSMGQLMQCLHRFSISIAQKDIETQQIFFRKLLFKWFTEFNASSFVFIHDDNLSFWKKKFCLTIDLRQLEAKYLSVYQKLLCFSKVPDWTIFL